ncbi:endo-1,4-beta-xylanase [Pseudomonas syringae CC1557]|uniref:Beta-xylanase n=1 Tax=Pseudomonas syringae CC1557 TaxID=1357279 RepID=W0MQI3_PSESX|nr:endo-1,4-beta-xylanase [Pseudomonas syringae]AHG39303.1 endo-1,4-beta-xylanase [Pseudomonas syringae CC1557]
MRPTGRRSFLTAFLRLLACAPFVNSRLLAASETFTTLRQLAAEKGIRFGFAVDPVKLNNDAAYGDLVASQAGIVVPENALKWQTVHPEPDRYDFAPADTIAAFAKAHDQRMRGHTFCWHRSLPDWVYRTVTPANAEAVLTAHISTVASHYHGLISAWDVVNEAIQIEDGQTDGLRNSFWYQMLGPRYLDIAFQAAHKADPNALLCYNDYGLEKDTHYGESRRAAVLAMLHGLKQRGIPVQGLGIQSHLRAGDIFGPGLSHFILAVRDMGLSVHITELDVDDSRLTGTIADRDGSVASTYKRYLDVVLATRSVSTVITWGVWDSPHIAGATSTRGPLAQRALVFGPRGEVKPASWVVEHCLERASTVSD